MSKIDRLTSIFKKGESALIVCGDTHFEVMDELASLTKPLKESSYYGTFNNSKSKALKAGTTTLTKNGVTLHFISEENFNKNFKLNK